MVKELRQLLQVLADRSRSQWDRLVHVSARRRARSLILRHNPPKAILVVCTGNIFRSPYAASLLRAKLLAAGIRGIEVESAGFIGPERPADPRGASLALQRGHDLSGHRSRLILTGDAIRFDLVVGMTRRHLKEARRNLRIPHSQFVLLGDFDTNGGPTREIEDPFGRDDEVLERVFNQIERSVQGLSSLIATCRG